MNSLKKRKQQHLDICLDPDLPVERGQNGFAEFAFCHKALPECSLSQVNLDTSFLGYTLKSPFLISCMTGGAEEGVRLNCILAQAAEQSGVAIGTGSIRVMLDHPETQGHFEIKNSAPGVPVLANIGAAQIAGYGAGRIMEAVKRIGADGIFVHLNAAQEYFQDGGDRDYRGWKDGIRCLIEADSVPVLVKETGCGIPPAEGLPLLDMGAMYIDIAGSGGTDWMAVENLCRSAREADIILDDWGYPTAELLLAYRDSAPNRIIASGGLRSPRDFALSLACGAYLAAAALPFIRAAAKGGVEAVSADLSDLREGLTLIMALCGTDRLEDFRSVPLRIPSETEKRARLFAEQGINL